MMKTLIRTITPNKFLFLRYAFLNYYWDFKRFIKYSSAWKIKTETNLASKITTDCHTIEKGLTMPQTRLGFGNDIIQRLIFNCEKYISLYGFDNNQIKHTISVLLEYKAYHTKENFEIDASIIQKINKLHLKNTNLTPSKQIEITKESYFSTVEDSFLNFSKYRHSVRNFTMEDVNTENIKKCIEITQNTTPSACNRQTTRVYIYTERDEIDEILKLQSGNRGFGHLSNKLIILTAELGVFDGLHERYQGYIDGGMYAMNLLYALHNKKIATCILNCSHDFQKDKKIREICKIKDSEVFLVMIACGIPPDNFKLAISNRNNYLDFLKIF